MKVSVVVPAFNEERYLAACLQSLLDQSVPADEIIVVDNNSKDKTREVAKTFPVKLVSEKNQGIAYTRNRGFNEAQYDLILRTDADTIVPKHWIKRIKEDFSDPTVVGVTGPSKFYEKGDVKQLDKLHKIAFFQSLKTILGHHVLFGPNMAIRKTAWDKIKDVVCLSDDEVHEDMDVSIHLAPLGKIVFDKQLIVSTSARRLKQIMPFIEYPYRFVKTLAIHNEPVKTIRRKSLHSTSHFIKKIKQASRATKEA